MRNIFVTFFFMMLRAGLAAQDIADVSVSGSGRITVWDAYCQELSSRYLGYGEALAGFSSDLIVISNSSGRLSVYNQKFEETASRYLGYGESIRSVCGKYILLKNTSGRISTFDKNFREISSRYE